MIDRSDNQNADNQPSPNDATSQYLESTKYSQIGTSEALTRGFLTGESSQFALGGNIFNKVFNIPTDKPNEFEQAYEAVKPLESQIQNHKIAYFIGNIIGSTLGGGALATERLAVGAADLAATGLGKTFGYAAPEVIKKLAEKEIIPKLTLTGIQKENIARFGRRTLTHGAAFAGFMAPEEFQEAYDPITHQFNYNKATIGIGANFALGAAIPAGQFLLGILFGRFSKETVAEGAKAIEGTQIGNTVESKIATVNKALEKGEITSGQHAWYTEHAHDLDSPKARSQASELLAKEGFTVDSATKTIALKLITEQDSKNLNGTIPDQLFSDVDNKMSPSDFIHHARIDAIRENPIVANGIDGWTNHIDHELEHGVHNQESIERMTKEALESEPPMAFSQQDLLNKIEKMTPNERAALPFTLPKEVKAILKNKPDIKILSPKQELTSIYNKLIRNDKLKNNFRNSKAYHRLLDLGAYWPQARKLIDRIHLENARNAQRSYSTLLKMYSAIIKAPLDKIANPENITKYLRDRIENAGQKASLSNTIKLNKSGETLPENLRRDFQGKENIAEESKKQIPIQMEEIQHGGEEKIEGNKGSAGKGSSKGHGAEGAGAKTGKEQKGSGVGTSGTEAKGKGGNAKVEGAEQKESEADATIASWDKVVEDSKGEEGKTIYKNAKRRVKQWQKSAKVLADLISCQLGATNGQV